MPYEMIWEDRGVVSRYWGAVTGDELIQNNLDEKLDPRFDRCEYDLVIFTGSVVFDVSSSQLRFIAESDANASKEKPNFVVAIVASQTVIHGLTNLYRLQHEVSGGQWNVAYFATKAEARQWLAEVLD